MQTRRKTVARADRCGKGWYNLRIMFAYDLAHWMTFAAAAMALTLAPGPDLALIIAHTVKGGRRNGFAAMAGIWAGALGHVTLAAFGLSAILAASATAFAAIKWAGAAYLVWVGVQTLRGTGGPTAGPGARHGDAWRIFRQGVLTDLLNPKVAIFFLAFLPQFVVEGAGPVWAQLALHGVLVVASAVVVEPPLILLGERLAKRLHGRNPRLERALGGVLIGLGVRLALIEG